MWATASTHLHFVNFARVKLCSVVCIAFSKSRYLDSQAVSTCAPSLARTWGVETLRSTPQAGSTQVYLPGRKIDSGCQQCDM